MAKKKIEVAIVGTGHIAQFHVDGFRRAGAEVVASINPNLSKAEAFSKENDISSFYSDLDTLFKEKSNLSLVSICTPTKFHRDIAIKALRNGKNVYSEKPPTIKAKEVKDIEKEAKKASKLVSFAFNNRKRESVKELFKETRKEKIGNINFIEAVWARKKGIPGQGGWFTNKELSGGGVALDLIHTLDLALYILGFPEVDYVVASNYDSFIADVGFSRNEKTVSNKYKIDVESSSHSFITFKNGISLYLHTAWAEMREDDEFSIKIYGTEGGVTLTEIKDNKNGKTSECLTLIKKDKVTKRGREKDISQGRYELIEEYIKALKGREAEIPTLEEAYIIMKIMDALYLSSRLKRPVKFSSI